MIKNNFSPFIFKVNDLNYYNKKNIYLRYILFLNLNIINFEIFFLIDFVKIKKKYYKYYLIT